MPAAELVCHSGCSGEVSIRHGNVRAGPRQRQTDRPPNAATAAGDQGPFALE
jgi:hypothetical protein